jgi:hypothetical protein
MGNSKRDKQPQQQATGKSAHDDLIEFCELVVLPNYPIQSARNPSATTISTRIREERQAPW